VKQKQGQLIYTGRAFHQDSTEAMGGDIVRALIETITNADDAYGDKFGKIMIEIEHRRKGNPWKVVTKDRAIGMSALRMEEAIIHLGGRTSGFENGANVRGNLGRGSKDLAAFGKVSFESICDDEYAHLVLDTNGNYTLEPPRKPTADDRQQLGIPRNGTVVTINVTGHMCPQHEKLIEKLRKHYQLRDIMADPNREVRLVNLNNGISDIIRFSFPDLPTVLSPELVELVIEGYPNATALLTIFRNAERYDDPSSDHLRPAGLLIKGRRAIYENTLFRFENSPHAGWFSGRVECPYIDQLAAEYDRRLDASESQDETNPIPIITRRRDGLQKAHPFYRALATAIEEYLGPLIADEERKSREHSSTESSRLRKSLDGLGRDLSKLIDGHLREIDDVGLSQIDQTGANLPTVKLIPEDVVLYMGEDKTVSVIVNPEIGISEIDIQCDPGGVVEVLDGLTIALAPHRTRPDLLSGQIHLRPLLEDQTMLSVTSSSYSAVAVVEVRPEREIEEIEVQPVEYLQFERNNYRIAWTRKKAIRILAPLDDIANHGTEASITSSDSAIVVRTGRVTFLFDEELEQYVSEVTVEARKLASQATLTARLGGLEAICRIVVTKEEEGPSLAIKIVDKAEGENRALVYQSDSQTTIEVMGFHPIMKRYRGSAPPYRNDLPTTRLLVAEIVAEQVVRMILERKFPSSSGHEPIDAALLYSEHRKYLTEYLTRCHKYLLPDSQLVQIFDAPQIPVDNDSLM